MDQHNVAADPQEIKNAENFWHNFVVAGKISTGLICAILVALALAFVKF